MVARGRSERAALLSPGTPTHRTRTLALAAALLGLAGCATNPVSGRREFSLVSPAQELQIGREGYPAVLKEYGVYQDPQLQAYVDSVGHRLAKVSHLPDLEWHFTLLDDPTVNAFAMPGGYIYITRGIIAHLNSEAQLAGVLGHEIGHVTARHTAQRITQQQIAGLGLGVAGIVSGGFRRYSDAAQSALGIIFLKYSRDDETQADQLGVEYATKAGYDPREIPSTYAVLKRVSERSGQRMPAFLSTHPDPGDREQRTSELARQAAAGKTGLLIRNKAHVQRLEGVVFGDDPRHGYFEGGHFYHPELGFEMVFPSGWKTQNGHEAVAAVEPDQRAGMQLTLAEAGEQSPSEYVASLERGGKVATARGEPETIGGFPAWAGRLLVDLQGGGQGTFAGAFVRKADRMFEIVGRSTQPGDVLEGAILASARSFRGLADARRLAATPDRVHVVTLSESGTFGEVVPRLGPQALSLEDTEILNNAEGDEPVSAGQVLKIVRPGKK